MAMIRGVAQTSSLPQGLRLPAFRPTSVPRKLVGKYGAILKEHEYVTSATSAAAGLISSGNLAAANELVAITSRSVQGVESEDRGVLGAIVGLSAALSLTYADSADAASEVSQLAASDNRPLILATLFVPVVGWVLFNISGPLFRQIQKMQDRNRGIIGPALGLGSLGSLMSVQHADAATELSQLAAGDNRALILASLFVPAIAWVLFNISGPLFRQIDRMQSKNRGVLGPALGLGSVASFLAVENADAATELSQLAAGDNRPLILASLFVPAVAWVLFNIAGPLFRQIDRMQEKNRAVVGPALGLGSLASLMAVENANAASELSQLAAGDNRPIILASLFVPAVAWVLFNIAGPLFRQIDRMQSKR